MANMQVFGVGPYAQRCELNVAAARCVARNATNMCGYMYVYRFTLVYTYIVFCSAGTSPGRPAVAAVWVQKKPRGRGCRASPARRAVPSGPVLPERQLVFVYMYVYKFTLVSTTIVVYSEGTSPGRRSACTKKQRGRGCRASPGSAKRACCARALLLRGDGIALCGGVGAQTL